MTDEYATPKVHTALAAILTSLSVEKGGTLPANMGGKPYITASDLNAEIKRQFVVHKLILLPSEEVIKHEVIQANNRLTVAISIEGRYRVISTEDGSDLYFGAVGDGLAGGTAVASNIASTNALKNALLRLFLVTEQSVEDQAKNGVSEGPAATPRAIATAQKSTSASKTPTPGSNVIQLRADVKVAAAKRGMSDQDYMAFGDKIAKRDFKISDRRTWIDREDALVAIVKALEAGEVVD